MAYKMSDDELRALGVAGPTMLRMLRNREQMIIGRMHSEFRGGKVDQTANIAELCCIREQISELTTALRHNE